ncbi:unnamed protein product [Durusdinium trenchii]|uniref:Uncharacterized protein n=2 Tax=Durusdinium trenchii TaxID=1381693 RepID=A0ABP0NG87_9DINO
MAARELRSLTEVEEAERAERGVSSYVVAPRVPEALYGKLKERVATVAVATAIFIVASAGIQGLCFILNEQHLEKNLRALAQVQAVPEITWLIGALPQLVFFPAIALLLASILTGSLFATCGLMGTKAQSECCACCYCCCSAAYCIFLIPAIVGALFFLQSVSSASETAELWFGRCDPKLCYPLGFDTPVKRQIDCLAPAVWDEYRPQFSGNHLPQECPPMYLQCEENEDTEDTKEAEVVQARRLLVEPEEGEDTAVSAAPVAAETVAPDQDEVEEAEPRDTRDEKGAEDEADDGDADEEPEGASEEEEVADARDSSRGQEGKNDDDDDAADVERDAGADKEESKEDDQEDDEADAAEAKQRNDDLDDDQHVSGTEEETDQDADASPETVEAASSAASSARSQAEDSEEDEEDSEKEAQEASSDEKEGSGEEDVEDPDEDDAGEEAEDAKKAEEEEEEDEKDSSESPEEDDPQSSADEVEEEEEEDPQEEVLDFSESDQGSALKALGQASESLGKVLTLPMPEDPLTECKPSRIVALYKVAQREAPDVFQALWIQTAVRLLCMVPTMVLMAFGFWWGHEYWSKLTKGNSQTYLLANVPLGQGEPRDVQMTHMSQPLMVQA